MSVGLFVCVCLSVALHVQFCGNNSALLEVEGLYGVSRPFHIWKYLDAVTAI